MKKKISMIALLMALLISVGGLTSSVSAKSKKVKCLGTYKITAYCGCRSCSGGWGNRTASGRRAKAGRTISCTSLLTPKLENLGRNTEKYT